MTTYATKKDWFFDYIGEPETEPVLENVELAFGNSSGGSVVSNK